MPPAYDARDYLREQIPDRERPAFELWLAAHGVPAEEIATVRFDHFIERRTLAKEDELVWLHTATDTDGVDYLKQRIWPLPGPPQPFPTP